MAIPTKDYSAEEFPFDLLEGVVEEMMMDEEAEDAAEQAELQELTASYHKALGL